MLSNGRPAKRRLFKQEINPSDILTMFYTSDFVYMLLFVKIVKREFYLFFFISPF